MPLGSSDDVGRQPAGSRSLCPWLVVLFLFAAASSSPATDAAALHCSNQSTLVECVAAALHQARLDGRGIHAECCRSIVRHMDSATVIALRLRLLQCPFRLPDSETTLHRSDHGLSRGICAVSSGKASMICCAVQRAVGWAVTLKWTTCLLSCSRTTKPYNTLKVTVGTVKKSIATI